MTDRCLYLGAATLAGVLLVGVACQPAAARAAAKRRPVSQRRDSASRLPGHVLPALAAATRIAPDTNPGMPGSGEDAQPLTLTVVLKHDDQVGFDRYLQALYDPGSADYRRFLTQREIASRFGPSRRVYERILSYLRGNGLALMEGSENRLTLTVRGTRGDVERALQVHVGDYRIGDRTFHANDGDPALPPELASHVRAVAGLSNLATPHTTDVALLAIGLVCELQAIPIATTLSSQQLYDKCVSELWHLRVYGTVGLDPPPPSWLGIDGTGQRIGLLELDTFQLSDVSDFLTLSDLPKAKIENLSQVHVNGGASTGGNQSEVLIDIDAVMTVAPGAQVVVYDAPFTGAGTFQALFNRMINDGVTIISNSWAYCEDQTTAADVQSIDAILQNAAMSNIGVFNGSGDSGSTCLDGGANTVAVPADSPHATAVGGTSLTPGPGAIYGSEAWWNGPGATPPTGQGGFGVSRFFTRPSWQDGLNAAAMRSVPDVSVNADPARGIEICQASAGGCPSGLLFGGTSLAAPVWAAFAALLNQAHGQNLGFLNPTIYPLANTNAFHGPASMGSDFAHVGLGSPNLDVLHVMLDGQTVGVPDAAASEVGVNVAPTLAPATGATGVPSDGATPAFVVVILRDRNGNLVSGKTVTVTANAGSHATIAPPSGVTSTANGAVVFTLTDLTAETLTVTATDTTDGIVLQQTPAVPFVAPPASAAGINANPPTVNADGLSSATITVTLHDALNRGSPGKEVTLSQGGGHSLVTGPNPSVTDASGHIQFTATDLVNETVTYTAVDVTDGDLPVPGSAQVTFSNGAGSACGNTATPPTAAEGYLLTPFATGFTAGTLSYGNVNFGGCSGISPPAFLGANVLLVNFLNGDVFKLGASGGAASSASKLGTIGPTLGWPTVGRDGSVYATRVATTGDFNTGAVLQLDPNTGAVVRAVASNLRCPQGLALDPLSGDLFFDDECFGAGSDDPAIHRIRNPTDATPTVEVYATLPTTPNGNLVFAPNGSLYVATGYTGSTPPVVRVSGTNGPTPPTVTPLAGVVSNYWVNIGEVGPDGEARSLLTLAPGANVDLQLTDITANPPTSTAVAHHVGGGLAGPDGCLYVSDGTVVYKLTDAGGSCRFGATSANPSLVVTPATATPDPAQGTSQTFTANLRNVGASTGAPVFFQVTGANPQIKMVRADTAGRAALTYTAANQGRDVVVATATVNSSALTSNRAHVTWGPGKHVTFLTLNQSPTGGAPGRPVGVIGSVTDVSASPPVPVPGATVAFTLGSAQCPGTTDAHGSATCQLAPGQTGVTTLVANFAGSNQLVPSSAAVAFTVACPAGLDGVTCYLGEITSALEGAAKADVRKKVKRQLLGKVKKLGKLVTKARQPGKRGAKALKRLQHGLDAFAKKITRLRGHKFATALADTLLAAAHAARAAAT